MSLKNAQKTVIVNSLFLPLCISPSMYFFLTGVQDLFLPSSSFFQLQLHSASIYKVVESQCVGVFDKKSLKYQMDHLCDISTWFILHTDHSINS